ncbi:GNAT family N-acetyltransferase [Rhodococcus sp. X156]|uniref:N-acetylglutamate synthase, CG3035 family n=1 Tax=Rhodococcus sp. X156 TaxID=2499145 RepID=UPI001F49C449|nr:GNAT family N-acetyltransferase [Rhodococcus sp. X156]
MPPLPSLGQRVMLRYRLPAGGSHPMTDRLGTLRSLGPLVVVESADGQLTSVAPEQVVALKAVPAAPVSARAIANLEEAAARAWPGLEQQWLGRWLLRAGAGFSNRANTVLVVGPPGVDDAVEQVRAWYAERDLPVRFQVPDRMRFAELGWQPADPVVVLTAPLDPGAAAAPDVQIASAPDAAWLQRYHYRGQPAPDVAAQVVSAVLDGELGFARIGGEHPLAIGRGALTTAPDGTRWLGLNAIEVAAEHRRTGLGRRVCTALLRWGHERGAQRAYLQVAEGNEAALGLYRSMGFTEHHRYRYLSD